MKSLHTSLNTAHSGCKPSTFMSLSTHCFQVFLFLPLHLNPATSTFLQADTRSSTLLRSRCPNHLNLPRLTTSATLCTPRRQSELNKATSFFNTRQCCRESTLLSQTKLEFSDHRFVSLMNMKDSFVETRTMDLIVRTQASEHIHFCCWWDARPGWSSEASTISNRPGIHSWHVA